MITDEGAKPYKLILYKATDAMAADTDLDADIKTLPRKVRRDLLLKLRKYQKRQQKSLEEIFPQLDTIPEDGEADVTEPETKVRRLQQSGGVADSSDHLLPEERIAEDPNAEPDDDDDVEPEVDKDFHPNTATDTRPQDCSRQFGTPEQSRFCPYDQAGKW